jgi:hypothetical protein
MNFANRSTSSWISVMGAPLTTQAPTPSSTPAGTPGPPGPRSSQPAGCAIPLGFDSVANARFWTPLMQCWVVIPIFIGIMLLAVSGTLMFVFRFFYSGEVTFKQALAIVVWTFLAVGLISTPVMLTVLTLKGDWNVDPNQVVQANLGLLLDKSTAAKPLWALFTSVDAFVLWMVFLLAVGFGVSCKRKTSAALWGVVIPWLVVVAIKVGASALF